MIKTYKYNYNWHAASAHLEIDTDKLSQEDAQQLYDFFSWSTEPEDYDDIYDQLGYQYCKVAINFATTEAHNTDGVKSDFATSEGYEVLDGSRGITLINVEGIDLQELELEKG